MGRDSYSDHGNVYLASKASRLLNGMTLSGIGSPTGDTCGSTGAGTFAVAAHPGIVLPTSGTVSGSGVSCIVVGANNPGTLVLNGTNPWTLETELQVTVLPGTSAAQYQWGAANHFNANPFGLASVYFSLSSGNTTVNDWYCGLSTTTVVDSGVAATAATWVRLSMTSDGTNLHYWINGTQVCGTGTALTGLASTGLALAWTIVSETTSTSYTIPVDYIAWSSVIPTGAVPSATQR